MEIEEKKYASNAKGNAALTTGIIGTALGGLLTLGNGNGLFGLGGNGVAAVAEKENENYVDVTKQYYQGQISNIREIQELYQNLNNKIVDNSFALYKGQRDEKDALIARISALETKQAVDAAVEPWRAQVLAMQI
jgi:F0F1-type ATP synthase beta subunit